MKRCANSAQAVVPRYCASKKKPQRGGVPRRGLCPLGETKRSGCRRRRWSAARWPHRFPARRGATGRPLPCRCQARCVLWPPCPRRRSPARIRRRGTSCCKYDFSRISASLCLQFCNLQAQLGVCSFVGGVGDLTQWVTPPHLTFTNNNQSLRF